jgi:hypothetical protein
MEVPGDPEHAAKRDDAWTATEVLSQCDGCAHALRTLGGVCFLAGHHEPRFLTPTFADSTEGLRMINYTCEQPPETSQLGEVNLTGQSASIGSTNVMVGDGASAGIYRVSAYRECTVGGATGSLNVTVGWTDDNGSQSWTPPTGLSLHVPGFVADSTVLRVAASTNITYLTTVSGGSGSQYAIFMRVEKV